MKRNSAKNEVERNGAKHARLDINSQVRQDDNCDARVNSRKEGPDRQNTGYREHGAQSLERTKSLQRSQLVNQTNGIHRRVARIAAASNQDIVGHGIIHFHHPLINAEPSFTHNSVSKPTDFTALRPRSKPISADKTDFTALRPRSKPVSADEPADFPTQRPRSKPISAEKPTDFTALRPRSVPNSAGKPNSAIPATAFQQSSNLTPVSHLHNSVPTTNKSFVKASALPQASTVKSSIDSKSSSRPKPFSVPYSTNIAHQIVSSSVSTADISSAPPLNVLNRAQTLFSVSSLKDSTSDLIQGPLVPQFPLYDPLYMGSPIASPLFTDGATSFPFTTSDYIDPDSVYLDQLFSRSPSAQENHGFTSIRSENHCARTDNVQPFPFSSPRLLNTVVDPVSVRSQQYGATETKSTSQTNGRTNFDPKKKSNISALERLSAVVNNSSKSSSSATATCSSLSREETLKNALSSTSSAYAALAKIVPENGSGSLSQTNRPVSSDQKPGSSKDDLKPPPHGGIKRAGPYLLGPRIGTSPVKSIVQCLARKEGTDNFYTLKILTLENGGRERQDDRQGKMLIHTEYSLLCLLRHQDGVVHHHGLFKDEAWEERETESGNKPEYTGGRRKRLCLVLDCLIPHNFSDQNSDLINLQHYVIKEKKLSEKEAIVIFFDIVRVVECLHKKNIVHRDLKLGNMVLNKRSRRITITNFCLGKHLVSENDLLLDQRGSPAYISPDVLSGSPYLGKPSDMWALGVVLFTMLYGQFPFYDSVPQELFRKIKAADFKIPNDMRVSENTKSVVKKLLLMNPYHRLTASQVLDSLTSIIATWRAMSAPVGTLQVVPDIDDDKEEKKEPTPSSKPTHTHPQLQLQAAKRLADTEFKVSQGQMTPVLMMSPRIALARRRGQPSLQPPIQQMNVDAQPLSQAEIQAHRQIMHVQRQMSTQQ
ncbi:uncharacterized protein LOC123551933 [Mercenaria mercenaria]|uniref:uncharacterized protein LOC123551933 n=1 Tax=Mercenaria mercenaria TaxID=6596 RepID=UPI00234E3C70|nr:uncharacterized protein LOC123551933 [Mercenaria mercenaria]XP_045197176.2 uncharacterized protein LOC123551933 [Mercenaria mercenaria]